jgi:hypothetical protein
MDTELFPNASSSIELDELDVFDFDAASEFSGFVRHPDILLSF